MVVKVFILGRSGSGKSTTARFLISAAQKRGWHTASYNDYNILHDMFMKDTKQEQFRATANDGFEVTDFTVYQRALQTLEKQIQDFRAIKEETLITIEFAHNNYLKALNSFDSSFLENAHYLFLATDLNICLNRIHSRFTHPTTEDDFFVLETILLSHYPCPYMPFRIGDREVRIIENNTDSLQMLSEKVEIIAQNVIRQDDQIKQPFNEASELDTDLVLR